MSDYKFSIRERKDEMRKVYRPIEVAKIAGCNRSTVIRFEQALNLEPERYYSRRERRYRPEEAARIISAITKVPFTVSDLETAAGE